MEASNIVAGSNVFLSRTEDPRHDPNFVAQVQEFHRLQEIYKRKQVDNRVAPIAGKQGQILKTEMRCVYAKNDPCWGYMDSKKRVVSACINGDCPKILSCNPNYTKEEAAYWVTTDEERRMYGDPDAQLRYYIVDMISDEEMSKYVADPGNDGIDHPTPPAPVYVDKSEVRSTGTPFIIDPKTGRKMVVIGYSKLKYPDEDGLGDPIWGFVDEIEESKHRYIPRRTKKIEKKVEVSEIKKPVVKIKEMVPEPQKVDPDFARKDEFEKTVTDHITNEIKLTDAEPDTIYGSDTVILLDNQAELAFVSGTFLTSGIKHSTTSGDLVLAVIDEYKKYSDRSHVYISNTARKHGCVEDNVAAWKELSSKNELIELHVADRDFYKFDYDGKTRWTSRNMYGVTHVCVLDSDIKNFEQVSDGLYDVSLVDDRDTYMITEKNGTPMGCLGKSFVEVIDALKHSGEIPGSPAVIKGISILVEQGKPTILGMGHLKFMEY